MDHYEWDDAKNETNRRKHGFGFELIYEFDWTSAYFKPDRRFDYGEDRTIAYGRIAGRGYAVVYVERHNHVRLISLRPAHEKEMRRYAV
jgi:uncharacterized DUF497 family protein